MSDTEVKDTVRHAYRKIALEEVPGCCGGTGCDHVAASKSIGYTAEEIESVPEGSNLGVGCGNPLAIAAVRPGDVVLDLGSGAGFDCFLAAKRVGSSGHVIGVDMTPEMLERARRNAESGGYTNVEFREGELEALPVVDASVDLVISNCVINLVPDRLQVYREAFRVLKPGGHFAISDTLVTEEVPDAFLQSSLAKMACLSATGTAEDYVRLIEDAGFQQVQVVNQTEYPQDLAFEDSVVEALTEELGVVPEMVENAARSMISVSIVGRKPTS